MTRKQASQILKTAQSLKSFVEIVGIKSIPMSRTIGLYIDLDDSHLKVLLKKPTLLKLKGIKKINILSESEVNQIIQASLDFTAKLFFKSFEKE